MKRWLLWTFHCRRGRCCARVVVDPISVPHGATVMVEFTCGGCGTHYFNAGKENIRLG